MNRWFKRKWDAWHDSSSLSACHRYWLYTDTRDGMTPEEFCLKCHCYAEYAQVSFWRRLWLTLTEG